MTCNLQQKINSQIDKLSLNNRKQNAPILKLVNDISKQFNKKIPTMSLLKDILILSSEKCPIKKNVRIRKYAACFQGETQKQFHTSFVNHTKINKPFCFFIIVNNFTDTFYSHMLLGFVYKKHLYIFDPNGNISPKVNVYNIPDSTKTLTKGHIINPWYKHLYEFFSTFTLNTNMKGPSMFKTLSSISFYGDQNGDDTLYIKNCTRNCFYRSLIFLFGIAFSLDLENELSAIISTSKKITKNILNDDIKVKHIVDIINDVSLINNLNKLKKYQSMK